MASEAPYQNNGRRSTHDDSRHSDLAVLGADEYKNKRRLERILDALDNIPEQADRAREQYNRGSISIDARRIAVQDAVNDAILEAMNLLRDHERSCREEAGEAAIRYAASQDENFDPQKFEPQDINVEALEKLYPATGAWPHSRYFTGHPDDPGLGTIPQVKSKDIEVDGLAQFWKLDELWAETWTELEKPDNMEPREVPRHANHTVPRDISWAAAVRLKEFLNDVHDLEIQFESIPGGEAGFDYSDILDAPTEGFGE